jgi:predicted phosphoribosyltransferase
MTGAHEGRGSGNNVVQEHKDIAMFTPHTDGPAQRISAKPFVDRAAAGRQLAELLSEYHERPDVVVLALPRGGVPVGFEIAQSLGVPLDVLVVRKLGAPGQPEFAFGAIASGGVVVMNEGFPRWFADSSALEAEVALERVELARRERAYRDDRPPQAAKDRIVVLVDDGAATGSSMQAAVRAVRKLGAREIIVALPVASDSACDKLREEADRVVCIRIPAFFAAVGQWYENFNQTSDDEVRDLLARAAERK